MTTSFDGIGHVFGVILNDQLAYTQLGDALNQKPYLKPPQHPVLYIKPKNTYACSDSSVVLPKIATELSIGASLAISFKQQITKVSSSEVLNLIKAIRLVADLSIPHTSYFRPAIIEKCFDQSLVIGAAQPFNLNYDFKQCVLDIFINDQLVGQKSFKQPIRDIAKLVSDISQFMTLDSNDLLLIGVDYEMPEAKANDTIAISSKDFGQITFQIKEHSS